MTARSVVGHHLRISARIRHASRHRPLHNGIHFHFGVSGVPMDVIGHVAVAVMPAIRVPILLISIVSTKVPAIDRRLRVAIRPLRRHAMRRLDPAAEARHVLQAVAALRAAGEADELDLHR